MRNTRDIVVQSYNRRVLVYYLQLMILSCVFRQISSHSNCSFFPYVSRVARFQRDVCLPKEMPAELEEVKGKKRATFGMGCFWAGDSLFGAQPGVLRTCVGYSGGQADSPTYRNIGDHTEVVDVEYDPKRISYLQLLSLFWKNHEYGLTTKIKRQYISLILYHDDEQKLIAEKSREEEQRKSGQTFVTEIRKFETFYPAEDYHQKYRLQNHPWLMENVGLMSAETLMKSPIAAKLNGYLAGVATLEEFERDLPNLGLSEKAIKYLRKHIIENQGNAHIGTKVNIVGHFAILKRSILRSGSVTPRANDTFEKAQLNDFQRNYIGLSKGLLND